MAKTFIFLVEFTPLLYIYQFSVVPIKFKP